MYHVKEVYSLQTKFTIVSPLFTPIELIKL